jgi:protein-L-isoaspartate(D-aspartate) O-methyltransferase
MDHAALYANARNLMVDGQVRPNRVYDSRLLDAMRRLPREQFVPPAQAARAYADQDVPLGGGRVLTEPMVIARLLQLADIRRGERALVIAAGSGYSAALVAACEAQVTALEEDPALLALARALLPVWAPGVTVVEGPLAAGWPGGAPYDLILIDGAVEHVPEAIVRQLRPASVQAGAPGGGRLVTVQRRDGVGQGVVGEAVAGALRFAAGFDCATTRLAAFRHAAGFVF